MGWNSKVKMSMLLNKLLTRLLALLSVCAICACAPQSYYSSASYSATGTSPYRANSYHRASDAPYRDYDRDYYEALRQRRLRALADSYKGAYNRASTSTSSSGGGVSDNAHRYYSSSRLPASSTAISDNNNDPKKDAYAFGNHLTDSNSSDKQQDATTTTTTNRPRINKADRQNAKFAGIRNQEADEQSPKLFSHLKRKKKKLCLPFGRDAQGGEVTPPPDEQGRILWDVNVYNVYNGYPPPVFGGGCGGFGGGLGGGGLGGGGFGGLGGGLGGLLSDPIADAYAPPNRLNNFLQLFAPGILQNAIAATVRPPPIRIQSDPAANETNDVAYDPEVDPGFSQVAARPPPVRRPNRVYYDTAGAAPITPAQLVGGVATTVNGIIQQLTGNVQPVYPGYRSLSYGK